MTSFYSSLWMGYLWNKKCKSFSPKKQRDWEGKSKPAKKSGPIKYRVQKGGEGRPKDLGGRSSYRDESGVLTLECDREKVMEKVYVKLNLKSNIAFVLKTVFIIGIEVEIKKWVPGESK